MPAAWLALIAMSVTGVTGIAYLITKRRRLDLVSAASAEAGLVMALIVLATGPLWARPVWGAWWAWDARLVSMLALFLLFVTYQVLRRVLHDTGLMRELSAVVGVAGLVLVPVNHLAVAWFRTAHPDPVVLRDGGPSIPSPMLTTLLLATVAYAVLYVGFTTQRYGLALTEERGRALEAR